MKAGLDTSEIHLSMDKNSDGGKSHAGVAYHLVHLAIMDTLFQSISGNRRNYKLYQLALENKKYPLLMPVSEVVFDKNIDSYKIIENIQKTVKLKSDDRNKILATLMRLQNIKNYHVGIIEYEDDD